MVILSSLSHLAFLLCFVLSVSHVCAVTKPEWDGNSKLIYSYSCFVYNLNCLCRRLLTLHWLFEMFFDNICYYALLFYPPPPHPPLQLMVSVQKWAPFIYYNFVDDLLNVIFSPIYDVAWCSGLKLSMFSVIRARIQDFLLYFSGIWMLRGAGVKTRSYRNELDPSPSL